MLTTMFETPVEQWFEGEYAQIPERMRQALTAYVVEGREPGSFLKGVICNDLRTAVGHADEENLPLLPLYVVWFYNIPPAECHGSAEKMRAWLAKLQA